MILYLETEYSIDDILDRQKIHLLKRYLRQQRKYCADCNEISILACFSSSFIVNNQTNDDQQQPASTSTKKNLSSINSFEEWKQQQLHADLQSSSFFFFDIRL